MMAILDQTAAPRKASPERQFEHALLKNV